MGCVQERMPLLPLVSVPLLWHTTYDAIKVGVVHIGVGLCVVVLLVWAMRGPQCVEQQRAGFPRFFRMCPELCRLKNYPVPERKTRARSRRMTVRRGCADGKQTMLQCVW